MTKHNLVRLIQTYATESRKALWRNPDTKDNSRTSGKIPGFAKVASRVKINATYR
jgi:hypothetical protein